MKEGLEAGIVLKCKLLSRRGAPIWLTQRHLAPFAGCLSPPSRCWSPKLQVHGYALEAGATTFAVNRSLPAEWPGLRVHVLDEVVSSVGADDALALRVATRILGRIGVATCRWPRSPMPPPGRKRPEMESAS